MGLNEKRISASYQKEQFPQWQAKINALAGYDLAWEINWDELVKEGYAEYYPRTLDNNFFAPTAKALEAICADDMGKEALKAKIKKVKITSTRNFSSLEAKVDGDTLHLDSCPTYNREPDCVEGYAKDITKALEKVL